MTDKEKLEAWEHWVAVNIADLRKQYGGQWIAVIDNQVVAHGKDHEAVMVLLGEFGDYFAYHEYVHPESSKKLWDFIADLFPSD